MESISEREVRFVKGKNFLITFLENIINDFPKMTFTYKGEPEELSHYILIEPKEEYYNEEYESIETSIIDKFITLYPEQSICFTNNTWAIDFNEYEIIISKNKRKDFFPITNNYLIEPISMMVEQTLDCLVLNQHYSHVQYGKYIYQPDLGVEKNSFEAFALINYNEPYNSIGVKMYEDVFGNRRFINHEHDEIENFEECYPEQLDSKFVIAA